MRIVVTNDQKHPLRVGVEPWGDFADVAPGESIAVICSEAADGYVNVVSKESQLLLFAEGSRDLELRLDREGDTAEY